MRVTSYVCPNCKEKLHVGSVFVKEMNYCPRCGTFMNDLNKVHLRQQGWSKGILYLYLSLAILAAIAYGIKAIKSLF